MSGLASRSRYVGVFPNPAALLRLAGSVLVETHDELQVSDRRYPSEGLHGPIRQDHPRHQGGIRTDTPHGIISTTLADPHKVANTYTTARDVTSGFATKNEVDLTTAPLSRL